MPLFLKSLNKFLVSSIKSFSIETKSTSLSEIKLHQKYTSSKRRNEFQKLMQPVILEKLQYLLKELVLGCLKIQKRKLNYQVQGQLSRLMLIKRLVLKQLLD